MLTSAVAAAVGRTLTPLLHSKLNLRGFHSMGTPLPLHTSAAACESSATGIWLTGRAATSTLGHMSKSSIGRTLSVEMWECVCFVCVCLSVSMLRVCAAKGKSFLAATEELQGTPTRDSSERLRDSGEWGRRCSLAGVLIRSCNPWAKQINKQTANECWQFGKVCDKFGILQLSALPAPRNEEQATPPTAAAWALPVDNGAYDLYIETPQNVTNMHKKVVAVA